jgi:hypothetical protein
MKTLTLRLKKEYFEQIKNRSKPFEFRQDTPYWRKRIIDKKFDAVVFTCGYPKAGDFDKTIIRAWMGYEMQSITHKHFGIEPVSVFAIRANGEDIQGLKYV